MTQKEGPTMQKKELFQEHLPELVKGITTSYFEDDPSISYFKKDLPNRDEIIEIIHLLRQLVFPGVFTQQRLSDNSLEFYVGDLLMNLESKLKKQIRLALLCGSDVSLEDAIAQAECICIKFFQTFPRLREYIASDVQAAFDGDPAASDKVEVIFCYPGTYAIMVYRFAHLTFQELCLSMPITLQESILTQVPLSANISLSTTVPVL